MVAERLKCVAEWWTACVAHSHDASHHGRKVELADAHEGRAHIPRHQRFRTRVLKHALQLLHEDCDFRFNYEDGVTA